jgi:hypothetical protein
MIAAIFVDDVDVDRMCAAFARAHDAFVDLAQPLKRDGIRLMPLDEAFDVQNGTKPLRGGWCVQVKWIRNDLALHQPYLRTRLGSDCSANWLPERAPLAGFAPVPSLSKETGSGPLYIYTYLYMGAEHLGRRGGAARDRGALRQGRFRSLGFDRANFLDVRPPAFVGSLDNEREGNRIASNKR